MVRSTKPKIVNCHTENRNFCAPDGKAAALFIDLDGTCLICQLYFDQAAVRFGYFMKLRGFDERESMKLLEEIKRANAEKHGYEREAYAMSLVECYDALRKRDNKEFSEEEIALDRRICEDIGQAPFFRTPELFPQVVQVLNRAYHNFRLYAVTIGNREVQRFKISQAGLSVTFDDYIITSTDNKADLVKEVIEDDNIDPAMSAFIGNNQRSDGACLVHTNFIYLPLEPAWPDDQSLVLPQNTGFEVFRVNNWREAEERAIKRLIRRRHWAMKAVQSSTEASARPCCQEER